MSTVSEIAAAAGSLTLEEQRKLLERLTAQVREREMQPLSHPRVPGLHRGMVWVSEDFNDPLPDEFWLGKDISTDLNGLNS